MDDFQTDGAPDDGANDAQAAQDMSAANQQFAADLAAIPAADPAPAMVAPAQSDGATAEVGQYELPGVGQTYLNPDFADKVGNFITNMQSHGIQPAFVSGYRDRADQAGLHDDPTANTPAQNSLHSAGRAVDVAGWSSMDPATQAQIVSDAADAGLSWGGNFAKPDTNHFYFDPGADRNQLIDRFTQGINTLNSQIPDD